MDSKRAAYAPAALNLKLGEEKVAEEHLPSTATMAQGDKRQKILTKTMEKALAEDEQQPQKTIESALAGLQPLRDLAKNWDIDIASWYV